MKHKKHTSNLISTSLRGESKVIKAFRNEVKNATGRSMNATLLGWMESYLEERVHSSGVQFSAGSRDQLADMLADDVTSILLQDKSWARRFIQTAHLGWSGGILQSRVAHYNAEKRYLATVFSNYLFRRIEHLLDRNENVYILIDAGSTNLLFCEKFWPYLRQISQKPRKGKVTLVTNSEPVADAYAEQRQNGSFADDGTRIVCEVLGGEVQHDYAALTGPITLSNLIDCTDHQRRHGRFIALVGANFVRLDKPRGAHIIPLVRGAGQKDVKEKYVERADEVYVIAALGKMFMATTKIINDTFALVGKGKQPGRVYEDVPIRGAKSDRVKLVTTYRAESTSILHRHSDVILTRLGWPNPDDNPPDFSDITKVKPFCYAFDEHVRGKKVKEQIKIEIPHAECRADIFLKLLSVRVRGAG